jgi:hypothetical protein
MKDMKMKIETELLDLTKLVCQEKGDSLFCIDEKWHTVVKPFLKKREVSDETLQDLRKFIQDLMKAIQKKTDRAYVVDAGSWVDVVALVSNDKQHFTKAFQAFKTEFNY